MLQLEDVSKKLFIPQYISINEKIYVGLVEERNPTLTSYLLNFAVSQTNLPDWLQGLSDRKTLNPARTLSRLVNENVLLRI